MNRKNIKPLIMSSLAALSLGSMSVAGTFALFTDNAETTISIGAGEVNVSSSLTGVTLYSADASLTSGDVAGVITGDFAGTYYYKQQTGSFANGGTAAISGSTLSIERMSPGDKVVTSLGFVNDSNINIKYRVRVSTSHEHGDELLKNLELKIFGTKYHGLKSLQTKWAEIDAGASIAGSGIEVVLPLETGNEAQAKDAEIKFTLEAVQANAEVTDADKAEYYVDAISTTEYLAPEEITSESKTAVAKEIEVPLTAEAAEEKTVKVSVPVGAQLEEDASSLKLYVENMGEDPTYQGIAIQVDQGAEIYEVTLDGLDENNTEEITVTVDLGYQPLAVYHVHGEPPYATIPFSYDENTGLTTFTTTNFSEFTFIRDTDIIEIPNLAKLGIVRDYINNGHSLAGKTVKLLADLDFNNQEWTPIGTADHPFSGVFDGQGHTISNLVVNSASGYAGLFANVTGNAADAPHTSNEIWDSTSNTVILDSYSENKYSASVKNLIIDGFDITNTSGNYVGTAVAYGENSYFANLTVKNGTVNGNGKTGGVIGATGENVVLDYLSTESSVIVSATGHSVGGIIGGVNRGGSTPHLAVIANCTNRANVSTTDTSNGIAAGILGHGGSTSGLNVAVINCANYGEIKCQTRTAGIVAQAQKAKLILNCVNYGKVWSEATSGNNILGGIAGECDTNGLQIVACINNGEVTGYANTGKIAGIIGSIQNVNLIEGCVNNGTITNTKVNGAYSDITGGAANVIIANEATFTVDSSVSGEMTSVTLVGGETACTSIVIDNEAIEKVFVAIDNFNGTISGLSGKTLFISGTNNTVTIPQNSTTGKIAVGGTNCTIINNGTVDTIRFEGIGNHSIVNNGTITNTTDYAFTIASTTNGVNATITNNGTIEAPELEGVYVLYFGSGATCVVNNQGTITGNCFGKVTVNN